MCDGVKLNGKGEIKFLQNLKGNEKGFDLSVLHKK